MMDILETAPSEMTANLENVESLESGDALERSGGIVAGETSEPRPPDVFLWSVVAYGVSAAGLLLSALIVGLVVGFGLDGLVARGSVVDGLAGARVYLVSSLFSAIGTALSILCIQSGAILAARISPRSKVLHGAVSLGAMLFATWMLAIRL